MPTPSFVPIIGRDFSDVGGQQQFWAGFNQRQEEANLQRAQAAEQARNQFLFHVKSFQDQEDNRNAIAAERSADRNQAQSNWLSSAAEHAREFGITDARQRDALDNKDDYLRWHYDRMDAEKNHALAGIDNAGKFMVHGIQETGSDYDKAQEDYSKALGVVDTRAAALAKTMPVNITYDTKRKIFVAPQYNHDEKVNGLVTEANSQLAQARDDYNQALVEKNRLQNLMDTHRKVAGQQGLILDKRSGKYVLFSPNHNKTYGLDDEAPVAPAPASGAAPLVSPPHDEEPNGVSPDAGSASSGGVPPMFQGPAAPAPAPGQFSNPAAVKAAFKAGTITREQAVAALANV